MEAEAGGEGPRVGAKLWAPVYSGTWAQTAWAGYDWAIAPFGRLGLVAGATHYEQAVGCFDVCDTAQFGAFVGLSAIGRAGPLWLRLTPHYYQPLGGTSALPTLGLSGVPWVELGYAITPNWDVSLRVAETVFKLAYRF